MVGRRRCDAPIGHDRATPAALHCRGLAWGFASGLTGWGWGMVEPDTLGGDEGVRSGIDWWGLFVITCDGFLAMREAGRAGGA